MIWFIVGIFAVSAMLLSPYGRKLLGVATLLLVGLVVLGLGFVAWNNAQERKAEIAEAASAQGFVASTPASLYIRPVAAPAAEPTQDELQRAYLASRSQAAVTK